MSILSQIKIQHYIFGFTLIILGSYLSTRIKEITGFKDEKEEEYELIRKYLLTDSPLYGENKPKLWIHTSYEVNSRKWKSFYSRNSTDLNEPYLHLTVGSIINHCADDFNICLIDDNSIERLIPGWTIKIAELPEPYRAIFRQIGLLKIIYFYGGIICPNSFLCLKNLKELYDINFSEKKTKKHNIPFMCEKPNRAVGGNGGNRRSFVPSIYFFGAIKNCPIIKEIITKLENGIDAVVDTFRVNDVKGSFESINDKSVLLSPEGDKINMDFIDYKRIGFHYTSEGDFLGKCDKYFTELINIGKMTLLNGEAIGVKTRTGEPVLIDDLMEENYIGFSHDILGVYIPNNEILRRTKYQWFATISIEELLQKSNAIIVKFMKASIYDFSNKDKTENKKYDGRTTKTIALI